MPKIILAPYAARLFDGRPSPKDFPWWGGVVHRLNQEGHQVIQIGVQGEEKVEGVSQWIVNWPLKKLRQVIEDADCFLTVDSFLPHFVFAEKINTRGVVIWAQSNPKHWGHPNNINLLKSEKYLRPLQFQGWMDAQYNEDAFVSVDEVVNAVKTLCSGAESVHRRTTIPRGVSLAIKAA